MTRPAVDKRDGYRAQVDRAVMDFGTKKYGWTTIQLARAKRICYRTIFAETGWRNLANSSVPESLLVIPNDGYGKDQNSTGLYQQRTPWWDSVIGSMDPYTATQRFLSHMVANVPAWLTTDEATVCQDVQQSEYDGQTIDLTTGKPFPFAGNYLARQDEVDALVQDELYYTNRGD